MTYRGAIGLELELLAPPGRTRFDLARALAKEAGGALRLAWKYHGQGTLEDGRPDCHLTPAARVDVKGKWFASLVDDPTIVDELMQTEQTMGIARTDDVRLAAWIERACGHTWRELVKTFDGVETEEGIVDPWGHPLVRWHAISAERARVTEVVLRPLSAKELKPTLKRVMTLATKLGFTVPLEAAVHAHFDAAPFRSTKLLRRLVLGWTKERAHWLAKFEPNPRCRKLGPFAPNVVRVAKEADDAMPFEMVAAAMLMGGLQRAVDVNLLGLVERFPKQPTVEVRCLPGSLDAEATLQKVGVARDFVDRLLSSTLLGQTG
ncbi:MAG TPA: amidoligase family protein [Archangium sp.]